jgi:hypothetical protein
VIAELAAIAAFLLVPVIIGAARRLHGVQLAGIAAVSLGLSRAGGIGWLVAMATQPRSEIPAPYGGRHRKKG